MGRPLALRARNATTQPWNAVGRMMEWVEERPILFVLLFALAVRVALVAMSGMFESFALDDATYHQMASDMAAGDISHWDDHTYSLFWRTATFLGPVTLLYKAFDATIWSAQLYVAVLGAVVAITVTRLALEFLERRWAIAAGLIVALLPSQAFWSSQLMKDASVWLVLVVLALLIAVASRSSGRQLLLCGLGVAVSLVALAFLREHTLVVATWAVVIASFAGIRSTRSLRVAGAASLALLIPWLVAGVGPAGLSLVANAGSLPEIRFRMAQGAETALVDTDKDGEQRGGTSGRVSGDHVDPTAPGNELDEEGVVAPNIEHLPRGISAMLLEPFPLPFTGSVPLRLARVESVLWYPMLFLAAIGLWQARSHLRVLAFPILVGGGILVMYALSEGNIGTAHRHRGEFVWVVAILAAYGASRLMQPRSRDA